MRIVNKLKLLENGVLKIILILLANITLERDRAKRWHFLSKEINPNRSVE
jgi:hypothetical protein